MVYLHDRPSTAAQTAWPDTKPAFHVSLKRIYIQFYDVLWYVSIK
jgi:hypothetical protein